MTSTSVLQLRAKQSPPARGASLRQPVKQRRQIDSRVLARIGWLSGLAALVSLVVYGATLLADVPVSRVLVKGEFRQVDRGRIEQLVEPFLAEGFVSLDLSAIRQTLKQEPWVFDASVIRRWPGEVVIGIEEQTVIARWGKTGFLNFRGELFSPARTSRAPLDTGAMPLLSGPEGSSERVMSYYRQLNDALAQYGLELTELSLNRRGGWSGKLNGGVDIQLGNEEVMEKVRRFLRAYEGLLAKDFSKVKSIDMRYSRGFAVAWRDEQQKS